MNGLETSPADDDEQPTPLVREARADDTHAGLRADLVAAQLFPEFSRSRLSEWIKDGRLTFDGRALRPRAALRGNERLHLEATPEAAVRLTPQPIALSILLADPAFYIVDKPAGLVVHPGAGNPDGTLVNALLHHDAALTALPRAGIVHRLDKDTSGCLLVARTLPAHAALVALLAERAIHRQYEAIVQGEPVAGASIDAPIGRHPTDRLRMAVVEGGRPACSHFRLRERYRGFTRVEVTLETGRTHQIRVHMAHQRLPLLGDPLYGHGLRLPRGVSAALAEGLRSFRRQALHAEQLAFEHPFSGAPVMAQAPRPADLEDLIALLRNEAAQ